MKKRLAVFLVLAMMVASFAIVFADMNYGMELKELGIIKGDQNGNLNEANNLTREEAIVTLTRMMGQEEQAKKCMDETPFSDVPKDNWSRPYLGYAKKQGWTNGVGGGKFGLGENVTTQQYLTLMLRALGYTGSDVYAKAVQMGQDMNMLKGVKATAAQDVITRGDVFAVMYNTLYTNSKDANEALIYKLGLVPADKPQTGKRTVYPLTIKNFNRAKEEIDITFDKAPQKVVAVYQDSVETLLALGLEDHVVGFAGLDEDVKPEYADAFAKTNVFEAWSPDKESVLALEPDMILSWYSYFGDKKMGDVDFWHKRNVGTYMMRNSGADKRSLENEYKDILLIGQIFDVQDKAEAIVNNMKAEVEKVLAVANKMAKKPTVLVMEFDKKGVRVYGENTLAGDMVKAIGADLVTAPKNRMSGEDLIVKNPDVIFNVYFGSSSKQEDANAAIAKLKDDPKYASLSAVKNNRVYAISLSETYCSGTRTLDGIMKLAKGIYPDFSAEESTEVAAKKTTYPLTIKNFNRAKEEIDITFDKAPQKVVAVYQDSVETLLALGLEDHVVGFAGLDEDVKPEYADAFAKTNVFEAWSPDKESVLALEPDMILSWYSYFGDKKMGDVDFWHKRNVGTYMMRNSGADKRSLENEYKDILLIGQIFDVQDKAEAIVNNMKAEVEKVLAVANKMAQKPTVLVMEFDKKGVRVYGENTLAGDMVKAIGADLVTAPKNRMSGEDLIVKNPDVIFNVYFGSSSKQEDANAAIAKLKDDPKYASLSAVKNNRVYAISLSETYCSGTRTLDGIMKLAKGIYPDFKE